MTGKTKSWICAPNTVTKLLLVIDRTKIGGRVLREWCNALIVAMWAVFTWILDCFLYIVIPECDRTHGEWPWQASWAVLLWNHWGHWKSSSGECKHQSSNLCTCFCLRALWCRHQNVGADHPALYAAKIFEGSASYSQIQICPQLVFKSSPVGQPMLPDVECLIRIYLAIPVTTATAERTFFCPTEAEILSEKNYDSAKVYQPARPVHKDRTDSLDLRRVGDEFVGANDRRKKFFGSFALH